MRDSMINVTLFSQILQHINRNFFTKVVEEYSTDKHNKGINSWTHLVTMLFCQFAKCQSIRETTNGLLSVSGNLNHLGIQRKSPSKSSLSYINSTRDWQMFRDLYYILYKDFQRRGYFQRKRFKGIKRKIFMLDSTVISVCIKVFDWAKYKKEKGAIKLHTLLDYDGCMPKYVYMTEGKRSDVKHANYMLMPAGSVIVADRGYIDFKMLYGWLKEKITFVMKLKDSIKYEQIKEFPLPEGKDEHILKDEKIRLTGVDTKDFYPEYLRRVVIYSETEKSDVELITNNFSWTASTIAELYKQRWSIETFFKELKQHLKIKSFIGTKENAMWIQIWTALITLLLLKYLKEISKYGWSLSNLIAFLRMNLLVKIVLTEWLDNPFKPPEDFSMKNRQESFF
jgi:hypothetical protein